VLGRTVSGRPPVCIRDVASIRSGDLIDIFHNLCNLMPPGFVTDGLTHFENKLKGVSYAQPAANTQLSGSCSSLGTSWIDQAGVQHSTHTYMAPLGGVNIMPPGGVGVPSIIDYKPA
jgi:hypothetical protein